MDVEGVLRFWNEFSKWFLRMKGGPKDGEVSTTLVSLVNTRYSKNKNELRRMKEILEMITYFYVFIHRLSFLTITRVFSINFCGMKF